ncbi:MAG TPA: DUF3096 domain-containing protein [bacterium]
MLEPPIQPWLALLAGIVMFLAPRLLNDAADASPRLSGFWGLLARGGIG